MSEVVKIEKEGAVLEIILNRPHCLNAMNMELFDGMIRGLEEAKQPEIRVVLIRGEGKFFSVGGDIKEMAKVLESESHVPIEAPEHLHKVITGIRQLPKPVLAVVHGACAGAGLSLMLACDLVIAAKNTGFLLAYIGIGVSPDGGSTHFLPQHVGIKKAVELFLTKKPLTARQALNLGLINRVVASRKILKEGRKIAQSLSQKPTVAVAKLKVLLKNTYNNELDEQLALEAKFFSETSHSEDFHAGVAAFLKKKPPVFRGL